jgi:membrane fusion protein, copper/silver efflux system
VSPTGRNNKFMSGREKRWLLVGIAVGLIIAAAVVLVEQNRRRLQPVAAAPSTASEPGDVPAAAPATAAAVELTGDEQKAIGVETVEVKRQTIRKEISAPGKVAEPETGIGTISARIGGRIDKLLINVTGETVNRGQTVALIYSPQVFTAGEEYRLALENRQRLAASKESQAVSEADALVQASRRRLELWGLTAQQVEEIALSPDKAVQIATYSSLSGVVTKRNVAEGQYVKEGDVLFELADLSSVWVQVDFFESDIPIVRTGQRVKVSAPTLAGGSTQGTISFLQPSVDPQSHTMTARIQAPNPQMRLRPGMFVQVSLETPLGTDVIAVPRSAVLDTGKEKVVYVAQGNGVFEKRSVQASAVGDEYYAVTTGIKPGERVVTHGNFLIDSQTRLTGTITGMFGGSKSFGGDNASPQPGAPNYTVTLQSEPAPPKGGSEGTFHVKVTGPDGKPVTDAQVRMTLVMPAMPWMGMGEMRSAVELMWNGSEYVGKGAVAMAGSWNITVEARRGGQLLAVYRTRFDAK